MPTCLRCKVAYLEGESHVCLRKRRRGTLVLLGIAAVYAAVAYEAGSMFQPGVVAIYLVIAFVIALRDWLTTLLGG